MKTYLNFAGLVVLLAGLSGCDSGGESRIDIALEPSHFTSMQSGADAVGLSWQAIDHADHYKLYRCDADLATSFCPSECSEHLDTLSGTEYQDRAVAPGQLACYSVSACNEFGCAPPSGQIHGFLAPVQSMSVSATSAAKVLETQTAVLHASTINSEGTLTYAWSQVSGPAVVLENADSANASFVAPAVDSAERLSFNVLVRDANGPVSKTVSLIVNPDHVSVNAGVDSLALVGHTVSLHGRGAGEGSLADYRWQQLSGPVVVLDDATSSNPSFVAPDISAHQQALQFELSFNDGIATAKDTVTVAVVRPAPDTPVLVPGLAPVAVPIATPIAEPSLGPAPSPSPGAIPSLAPVPTQVPSPLPTLVPSLEPLPSPSPDPVPSMLPSAVPSPLPSSVPSLGPAPSPSAQPVPSLAAKPLTPSLAQNKEPLLLLAPAPLSAVGGTDLSLSASARGGDGGYQWHWSLKTKSDLAPDWSFPGATDQSVVDVHLPRTPSPARYTLTVELSDRSGTSISRDVEIYVGAEPGEDPLRIYAPDMLLHEGPAQQYFAVTVEGGTPPYRYQWLQLSGPDLRFAPGAGADGHTVTLQLPAVDGDQHAAFEVVVTDDHGTSVSEIQHLTIFDAMAPHIAKQALAIQPMPALSVVSGQSLQLSAFATGGEGSYSWSWSQLSGPTASLSAADTVAAVFTPADTTTAESVLLEVSVTDAASTRVTQQLQINVEPRAPDIPLTVALIPSVFVDEGADDITLTTAVSGGTGNYSYAWRYAGGANDPAISFKHGSDQATAVFDAPLVSNNTVLPFEYTVSDGVQQISHTLYVVVYDLADRLRLKGMNNLIVKPGDKVHLQGGKATGGTAPYILEWNQVSGPHVWLSDNGTGNAYFTVEPADFTVDAELHFEFTVTDALGNRYSIDEQVTVQTELVVGLDVTPAVNYRGSLDLNAHVTGGTPPYQYFYGGGFWAGRHFSQRELASSKPHLGFIQVSPVHSTIVADDVFVKVRDANGREAISPLQSMVFLAQGESLDAQGHVLPTKAAMCKGFPPAASVDDQGAVACSSSEALLGAEEQMCPPDRPYAFTRFIQTSQGSSIHKGCASAQTCLTEWTNRSQQLPGCGSGNSASWTGDTDCFVCCSDAPGHTGPACNSKNAVPQETWFKPTPAQTP
ncbi:PKD domain-containing protein [Agaribacterium haliotis]|uniref:PKD domain-containing protein n=1 Tax=Agaribacterium haliotis TaxID=2013869 RepID=UPI001177EA48|nr:hypothetical protein [Agaribacterium haliotis]